MDTRTKLRQAMRQKRRGLLSAQHSCASQTLAAIVKELPAFKNSKNIAAYMAFNFEIDPMGIMEAAWEQGKTVYLPRLHRQKNYYLEFQLYKPDDPLIANHFGIPEPIANPANIITPDQLDLILMPLLAFDEQGMRLGYGAAYYDNTFAFTREHPAKPYLMGIGFDFQKVEKLEPGEWDILMHGVATDKKFYPTKR